MRKIIIFILLIINLEALSQVKFDTIHCRLLYNKYDYKSYSLHFDGGDQLSFTPDFFMLIENKLTDSGFIYLDSMNAGTLNDSNHVKLYSKSFLDYLVAP